MANVILQRAQQFWQRVRDVYLWLSRLPRGGRRRLQGKFAGGLVNVALVLAAGPPPSVQAATITVDSTNPNINSDGLCSLIEAMINANNDAQTYTDCPSGNGADIIVLPAASTLTLTAPYTSCQPFPYGSSNFCGLPVVTSPLTIEGQGATIRRDPTAPDFRILGVSELVALTLKDTTISGGKALAQRPGDG
jgi:hypothetical protein